MFYILMIIVSSFLWRVRGGLRFNGKKLPVNKIWYAVMFGIYSCLYSGWIFNNFIIGFIACYTSYQLYGWGVYLSCLLMDYKVKPDDEQYKECELIDDLLYPLHITIKGEKYYLYQYPRLFGFCGTCLTGLIITFIWGLCLNNIWVMLSGLGMGVCYWLGGLINNEGKNGWNIGEWVFGAYLGLILAISL